MSIRILSDLVINQISAGEVVDRPSSVVRELVDNAVDAGATDLLVEIEGGGQQLIRVTDNGCGMNRDDALLAFERHATSKLQDSSDLERISTYGFRGEALPSIAAVSRVVLITRSQESELGYEVTLEGGSILSRQDRSAGPGTSVEVRNLFFNTPARRKFLKSERSEEQRIKGWMQQSAIIQPAIRYRLNIDGREVLNLPVRASAVERAEGIFKGTSVRFSHRVGPIEVGGVLLHPEMARAESSALSVFVNGRLVSDKMILRAVKDGYQSTLKDREFPLGFVSIRILPEFVDVNVHPQKSEVRFRNSQAVFGAVMQAVRSGVNDFRSPGGYPPPAREWSSTASGTPGYSGLSGEQHGFAFPTGACEPPLTGGGSCSTSESGADFRFSNLVYIGQALECYLLCEQAGALYVVDMHAAHERYNYNLIRNGLSGRKILSQQLLVTREVELGEVGEERCMEHSAILEKFGFEFDSLGGGTIAVRAVPSILAGRDPAPLIREIAAAEFADESAGRVSEEIDHIAARLACHASIRSGKEMTREEVYALFASLDSSQFSAACPHGRPVIVRFDLAQVEKWFGRDR